MAGKAMQRAAESTPEQVLRAAAAALYWGRRKDPQAVKGAVAGLSAGDRAVVGQLLRSRELDSYSDGELLAVMEATAAAKAVPAGRADKQVGGGDLAKAAVATLEGTGFVEGYASTWRDRGGADRQGEVVAPGAYRASVAAINSGAVNVPLMAAADHEWEDATVVVGRLVAAREDRTGLWIRGEFGDDPHSQAVRAKARSGGLSFSVGGFVRAARPARVAGKVVRELVELDLAHVLLTPTPANRSARITTAKADSVWALVTPAEEVEAAWRRNDPDVARRRVEDRALADSGLPGFVAADPQLRREALRGMELAGLRKAAAARPVDRAAAAREQNNERSYAAWAWQRAHAGHRRCRAGGCDE